ncbi:alpha/beta fold hydrolase [Pyxidicoccus fallax]|uniref:Alpha/beta hydrolase n=1 Tax=Pyxidicoccus fallax TaxID=394095 RepID=A0A848LFU5_9BACT|nr:alpha/beta hydrolase [Pyxidicoccus fallax]NPC76987.1 alpha/beta fold hydrolase [Pyxidicoccus fallax]
MNETRNKRTEPIPEVVTSLPAHLQRSRGSQWGLLSVLILTAVAGCSDKTPPDAAPGEGRPLLWGNCPALPDGATRDPRQTCATLQVPLDYHHPDGRTLEIAISRIATARPDSRRGVLLLNPGGPGLEGLELPSLAATVLPSEVLERYDLIGFDPRGVGHSAPVTCGLTDVSLVNLFPYPAADGSIDANVALARETAARCAASTSGDVLPFITTANTARDMDQIRQALGEGKISYWGQSYGTYLGAVYASLFAENTDRMVLEGNVDPTRVWYGTFHHWSEGMASRFPDAARVAAANNDTVHFGTTVEEVTAAYLELASRLDATPASVPGTSARISGGLFRTVTYSLLEKNEQLPLLVQLWRAIDNLTAGAPTAEDAALLQQVFAQEAARTDVPADNQTAVFLALACGDASWPTGIEVYRKKTAEDRAAHPLTAGMPFNIWPCAFWKTQPREAVVEVTRQGEHNILLLQNRRDNATPWESGLGMRKALGARATFVEVDAGGHYVYGQGSSCVDGVFNTFLMTGQLPQGDVSCAN